MSIKKKILVCGGAGFIGSHLCDHLLKDGHEIEILDNLETGNQPNIHHLLVQGIKFYQHDICQPFPMVNTYKEIYNLASPASPKDFTKIPLKILLTNSLGFKNVLDFAKTNNSRVLQTSTSEVYGDALVSPQPESYFGNVNCFGERSCYDEGKRFGEALAFTYQKTFHLQIRIARIFNTYGPRMRLDDGRVTPNFFRDALQKRPLTIYGNGSQTRSFCYVDDMVSGLISIMNSKCSTPINIGNPHEVQIKELGELINDLTNNSAGFQFLPLPKDDPQQRRPDISKIQNETAWKPKVSLIDGLKKSMSYFSMTLENKINDITFNAKEPNGTENQLK